VTLSPAERVLRARLGAHTLHSRRDPRETTSAARSTFLARFEEMVDPGRELAPAERARRAASARKAHFAALALKSARVRRIATVIGASGNGERRAQTRRPAIEEEATRDTTADGAPD